MGVPGGGGQGGGGQGGHGPHPLPEMFGLSSWQKKQQIRQCSAVLPRYIAIKCLYRERRYIAINLLSYREINVYGCKQRYTEKYK